MNTSFRRKKICRPISELIEVKFMNVYPGSKISYCASPDLVPSTAQVSLPIFADMYETNKLFIVIKRISKDLIV